MKGYCDITDIENYLLVEIDESFKPHVEKWIEAMENYIEQETGRVFIANEEFSERKYDGDGEKDLLIDDAVEIEKVIVDGEEIGWLAYPTNETPKIKIQRKEGVFPKGSQNVVVSAKWGYSVNVPQDIRLACAGLVAGIINRLLNYEGEVVSESVGPYSVTYKNEQGWNDFENIKKTLQNYKRFLV